jgi:adenylyl- and sulfurtransferase ThiI
MGNPYLPNYLHRIDDESIRRLARHLAITNADILPRRELCAAIERVKWRERLEQFEKEEEEI